MPEINDEDFDQPTGSRSSSGELEARVGKLEHDLAEMKEAFDKLMKELMG